MPIPFFTNGVPERTDALTGGEKIPSDGGTQSESLTTRQIGDFSLSLLEPTVQYATEASIVDFTATGVQCAGAALSVLALIGDIVADRVVTLPTTEELAAAFANPRPGMSYVLRILNGDATNEWTLAPDPGGSNSIIGNDAIPLETWREWAVVFDEELTIATVQSIGAGVV